MIDNEHGERATKSLKQLGLREYEAKCFVALSYLSEGTAKEVSEAAGVPRSRVYDSLEELHGRGLVDIQEANPRRYRGVPVETAIRTLQNEFNTYLETAGKHLDELQSAVEQNNEGIWTVHGEENITDKGISLIAEATDEIFIVVPNDERAAPVFEWVLAAAESEVSTYVDVSSLEASRRVEELAPDAVITGNSRHAPRQSKRDVANSESGGRAILVDRQTALLSTTTQTSARGRTETAVMSTAGGIGAGVVNMVNQAFATRRSERTRITR
jgi:sugar-specific transcriptional regulator TrmB